jgi:hypothetical protein
MHVCLSVCLSVCLCTCVCVCVSDIGLSGSAGYNLDEWLNNDTIGVPNLRGFVAASNSGMLVCLESRESNSGMLVCPESNSGLFVCLESRESNSGMFVCLECVCVAKTSALKKIKGSEDPDSGDEEETSFREPKGGKGDISKGDNSKGGGGGWKLGGMEIAADGKWGKASYWDPGKFFFHGFFWCI